MKRLHLFVLSKSMEKMPLYGPQQDQLMIDLGLDPNNCLGGKQSTKDCFIRSIPGADNAFYSKIGAQSTWSETLTQNNNLPEFNSNNVIFFEISPWIPPGTSFSCRFRMRFTNCTNCWQDSNQNDDDYLDYEFSGDKPFKIINFEFVVLD